MELHTYEACSGAYTASEEALLLVHTCMPCMELEAATSMAWLTAWLPLLQRCVGAYLLLHSIL